ncbi:MAG: hypothetical protein HY900_33330 [Deltaproteobacteria bacterium]|nr:hypothetical protein [Deltaproteobacteria bacterium]
MAAEEVPVTRWEARKSCPRARSSRPLENSRRGCWPGVPWPSPKAMKGIAAVAELPAEEGFEREKLFNTADQKEGVAAFLEKREPAVAGR